MDTSVYDLDLFFNCGDCLAHFATAGGVISEVVASNSIHRRTRSFLLRDDTLDYDYKLNPYLDSIFELKFDAQHINRDFFDREAYLEDFIFYAKKGCLSFDRTFIANPFDSRYHLVAYPIPNETKKRKFPSILPADIINSAIDDFFMQPVGFPFVY